jgi:hypothetical protein
MHFHNLKCLKNLYKMSGEWSDTEEVLVLVVHLSHGIAWIKFLLKKGWGRRVVDGGGGGWGYSPKMVSAPADNSSLYLASPYPPLHTPLSQKKFSRPVTFCEFGPSCPNASPRNLLSRSYFNLVIIFRFFWKIENFLRRTTYIFFYMGVN